MPSPETIETRLFEDDGATPNNPVLPLVVMRGTAASDADDPAAWFERTFAENGWGGLWRWSVYPYHHFHTENHEVLGVSSGTATLKLGGESGAEFQVGVGDVIVIPAGVGHKRQQASEDFQVVGAYPGGGAPDLLRTAGEDAESVRQRISEVPLPENDPVYGAGGPLFEHWRG